VYKTLSRSSTVWGLKVFLSIWILRPFLNFNISSLTIKLIITIILFLWCWTIWMSVNLVTSVKHSKLFFPFFVLTTQTHIEISLTVMCRWKGKQASKLERRRKFFTLPQVLLHSREYKILLKSSQRREQIYMQKTFQKILILYLISFLFITQMQVKDCEISRYPYIRKL
jgi:hypothetical protein